MVWNVMEGNKEGIIKKMGLGEATPPSLNHVSDSKFIGRKAHALSVGLLLDRFHTKAPVRDVVLNGPVTQVGGGGVGVGRGKDGDAIV
jgi:hypothetical protein